MYEIHLESEEFRGLRIVAQHMMVNKVCSLETDSAAALCMDSPNVLCCPS